jgi:hypothetical protein
MGGTNLRTDVLFGGFGGYGLPALHGLERTENGTPLLVLGNWHAAFHADPDSFNGFSFPPQKLRKRHVTLRQKDPALAGAGLAAHPNLQYATRRRFVQIN